MPRQSRIHPALFCSAAIHRGAAPPSVTQFLNHPDGCAAYVSAIREVFRKPICTGKSGRPPLQPWDGIYIAQVVKQYAHKHVVAVSRLV